MKKLENHQKINPFRVPENYFDNFNTEIMNVLPEKEAPKKAPLRRKILLWVAAAAVFCGILLSSNLLRQHSAKKLDIELSDKVLYEDDYIDYFEEQSAESIYKTMFYDNEL